MSTSNMAAPETVSSSIEAFRRDLGIRRSPHTVEAYTTGLRHFETFCAETIGAPAEVPATAITPDVAMGFVRWLQATNSVSHTTLDNYLTAISRFYRWLMLEERASLPRATIRRFQARLTDVRGRRTAPRFATSGPRTPSSRCVHAAYAIPLPDDPNTDKGPAGDAGRLRNIALLEVLEELGSASGRIVALRRGDLDYGGGRWSPARGASSGSSISTTRPGAPSPTI